MDNINYLFFVIFLPHAYLLDIIKSTYDADYGGYPVQLTTVPSNTTEKKIQAAEWWDFDEMEYNASQNNPNVQNDYVNGMESNEILSDLNSRDRINPIYLTPQNADSMLRRLTLPSMQDLKRRRKPFSFTVEGIVGSGKSTLLSAFKKYPFIDILPEPLEKWTNLEGNDMLGLIYTDPKRWGLAQESYCALTFTEEHLRAIGLVKGQERSVHSARFVFTETLRMAGKMSDVEYTIMDQWYRLLNNEILESPTGFDLSADLIVYLQTSPQIAYDRIKKRGRSEENGIQMSFLDNLNRLHEDWFINRNSTAAKTIPAKKLIVINTAPSFEEMMKLYHKLADRIWNLLPGDVRNDCSSQIR